MLSPTMDLLVALKTLADEKRLMMLRLMAEREYNVGELAQAIELSEPTTSHHLTKLHGTGFLSLRMDGNKRFYRLNPQRLERFKEAIGSIEVMPDNPKEAQSDNQWIEDLDWSDEDKTILKTFTWDGELLKIPKKKAKFIVILRWMSTLFEPDRLYTEKEISAIIKEKHSDYAMIRRYLVEYGFMRRERGGGDYWLAPEDDTIG